MLHAIANALALAPVIHRAPPEITNLQTIIDEVQEFYGKGWDTILWEVGLIVVLVTSVMGVLAPLIINSQMEKRLGRKISRAQQLAREIREEAQRENKNVKDLAVQIRAEAQEEITKLKDTAAKIRAELQESIANVTGTLAASYSATSAIVEYIKEVQELAQAEIRKASEEQISRMKTETQKVKYYANAITFYVMGMNEQQKLQGQPDDQNIIGNIVLDHFYAYTYCMFAGNPTDANTSRAHMLAFASRLDLSGANKFLSRAFPEIEKFGADAPSKIDPPKDAEYAKTLENLLATIRNIADALPKAD